MVRAVRAAIVCTFVAMMAACGSNIDVAPAGGSEGTGAAMVCGPDCPTCCNDPKCPATEQLGLACSDKELLCAYPGFTTDPNADPLPAGCVTIARCELGSWFLNDDQCPGKCPEYQPVDGERCFYPPPQGTCTYHLSGDQYFGNYYATCSNGLWSVKFVQG